MSPRPVAPAYRLAPIAEVDLEPWRDSTTGIELWRSLETWDLNTDVLAKRLLRTGPAAIRTACGLPDDARLLVAVEWQADGSGLSGSAFRRELITAEPVEIEAVITGNLLGGRITLRTLIILGATTATDEPFTAQLPGSILFEESVAIALQGQGAQFPISAIDFAEAGYGFESRARWRLETPDTLDVPTMGGVRLYVNAADNELIASVTNPTSEEPGHAELFEALRYDVARSMVECALLHVDELRSSPQEPGSFGATLENLLQLYLPDHSLETLTAILSSQPGQLATLVQAAVRRSRA